MTHAMHVETFACEGPGATRIAATARRVSAEAAARHRPDLSLVASADGLDLACASIWWTSVPVLEGERLGIVGHYASANPDAGAAVLEAACAVLKRRGATLAVGPMDGSTWRHYRLVTWGSAEPPFLLEPDNPADWPLHFERAGFVVLARYHSTCCDDVTTIAPDEATKARLVGAGFRLRHVDVARLDTELHEMWEVACDAFARNFLYAPIAEDEFRHLYRNVAAFAPADLTTIVERDGRMAGFVFSYPDTLRTPADTVVLKSAAVVTALQRHGLGQLLFDASLAAVRDAGYRRVIHALMHDTNVSTHFGSETRRVIRRYALFGRPL